MARYAVIELSVVENGDLSFPEKFSEEERDKLQKGDVVYIYYGTKSKKMYIGQTSRFIDRHKEHYSKDISFPPADFKSVIVLYSQLFNKSAILDVEKQLIAYFLAEAPKKSARRILFDEDSLINRTTGDHVNEYAEMEEVASDVILPFWEKELVPRGLARTPTIKELQSKGLVKYSPIKALSDEQARISDEIIGNDKNYVICGDAGTGKTVMLTTLAARFLKEKPKAKIALVLQPNWEKTCRKIFDVFGSESRRLTVTSSTKLIKSGESFDVIIVDEAHKLSRKYPKQQPSFNSVYKIPKYKSCESHLEILQKCGKRLLLMYDVLQAIRPANITREMFRNLTFGYENRFLKTQFRIKVPNGKNYTSEDYINGIKYLLYKDRGMLEDPLASFDPNFNRDVFRDTSDSAYFGYFKERPLYNITEWLDKDLNLDSTHTDRILAGLVEKWKQTDGKDSSVMHWHEGNIHRRWNSTQENWLNSSDNDAAAQIGSVFAVQGNDLNKVGVLIGADLEVDENGKLKADPQKFHNTNGKFSVDEMLESESRREFTLFVLNIYYVLLTRGIDGIRIGFWHNDAFMKYMEETLEINREDV